MNTQETIGILNYMLRDIENDAPNGKNSIEAQALTQAIEHMKRWQWSSEMRDAPGGDVLFFVDGKIKAGYISTAYGMRQYLVAGREIEPTRWMLFPEPPQEVLSTANKE